MNDAPVRASYLPIEHLEAELVAAPLASTAAFLHSLTRLRPDLADPATSALWRHVETSLLARFPGTSIDELIARRDRIWFPPDEQNPGSLVGILRRAAGASVDTLGRVGNQRAVSPLQSRVGMSTTPPDRQRRLWRWLSFALPVDLMMAASDVPTDCPVTLSSSLKHALREQRFAESHLHIGAAVPFDVLWSATHYALAHQLSRPDMFASAGAELKDGREFGPWMIRSALARSLAASFLTWRRRRLGFREFLDFVRPQLEAQHGVLTTHRLITAASDLRHGNLGSPPLPFGLLKSDFGTISGILKSLPPVDITGLRDLDPVGACFPTNSAGACPDFQFTREGLAYLRNEGQQDVDFRSLFWQLVRIRVAFYRHVVQRPMMPGLQWFVRTYERLNPGLRCVAIQALVETAVTNSGQGLRAFELRTQPKSSLSGLCKFIRRVDQASKVMRARLHGRPDSEELETGIVFHFTRSRGNAARRGLPSAWGRNAHADPQSKVNGTGYRFAGFYNANRSAAAALANLFSTFPRSLEVVRGLDLCGDELGVPLWVLRGFIQHAVDAANKAVLQLPPKTLPVGRPLRLTIHAGEDFIHLLSGVRRVGEAIEFMPLSEGDRIGHAIALGVAPEAWARHVQSVPMQLEERLLDLIWAWRLAMSPSSLPELQKWLPWLRERLDVLSVRIFGDDHPTSPAELSQFQVALHQVRMLRAARFPNGPRPDDVQSRILRFVIRWLRDPALFKRCQLLEDVDVKRETELIIAAQRQVRLDIGRRGITVEVNPSSNLLIGHLGSLESHPLWRLRPPSRKPRDEPPVRICIGSDDPIAFATTLPNEYQLVFDAMTESGISADDCDLWLDDVRRTSLDTRFTVPRTSKCLMQPLKLDASPMLF